MPPPLPIFLSKWRTYRRERVDPHADPLQIQETQRAFYAGAVAMFLSQSHNSEQIQRDLLNLMDEINAVHMNSETTCSVYSEPGPPGPIGRHHCIRCGARWDGPQESVDEHECPFDEQPAEAEEEEVSRLILPSHLRG